MFGDRTQHRRRQEQQRTDQQDRAQQDEAEGDVSVRSVPAVNGVGFLAARLPARASGAMIGMNRPSSITRPVAMSQCGL